MIAFKTELANITIGEVGQCFWDKGMLTTGLLNFGVSFLVNKFKGPPRMVVPYHICVSMHNFCLLFYSLFVFCVMTCLFFHFFLLLDKYLEWR